MRIYPVFLDILDPDRQWISAEGRLEGERIVFHVVERAIEIAARRCECAEILHQLDFGRRQDEPVLRGLGNVKLALDRQGPGHEGHVLKRIRHGYVGEGEPAIPRALID